MNRRDGCLVVMCLLLAACATPPAAKPSAGPRFYQLSNNQVASDARPIKRVLPTYPAAELASCPPPVEIQAQLIADKTGHVSDVRIGGDMQSQVQRRDYIDAVRTAGLRWRFHPLRLARWISDPDGTQHLINEVRPFSEIYVFHFECHGGRPVVTVGSAPPS